MLNSYERLASQILSTSVMGDDCLDWLIKAASKDHPDILSLPMKDAVKIFGKILEDVFIAMNYRLVASRGDE
jgi:hypothetical protein